ncbi:hypothetical protein C6990_07785 [Nitrosopumilus sp. b3]|uniref:sensor histidine kinase n=1 Tax=Nitrosopumilus sp. b3 TaxID=2109909 RepID=UPI0015F38559|nr:ATP-binding protein [Nitrosopumilus sp. b3]KAF6246973.1 hypothetical protein C6990_07785 [Nitrosopumilus sp. b3]
MNKKKWAWYAIIFAVIISLVIATIQIYSIEEQNIKTSITENQIEIQEVIAKSIAKNITSEMELIIFELENLAKANELQKDTGTAESSKLIAQTFLRINSISPTAQILALDEEFIVLSQASKNHESFVGAKVKGLSELIDLEKNSLPADPKILSINTLLFDEPEIAITYPIISEETKEQTGTLLVTFASSEFFKRHGNIYDVESQFLTVTDENHVRLIYPNNENFEENQLGYDPEYDNDPILNTHMQLILEGNLSTAIFSLDDDIGERISTGIPVIINDKIEFLFAVVTPTQSINKEIDDIIFVTQVQSIFLLLSTIVVLLALLVKRSQSFKKEKLTVIGQLSSNIAHDIRNPLGTIKNAGVIIQKENKDGNGIISREIDRINLSVRRISHQIEEVLNYVRTTPLILKLYSLNQIIQEAIDTLTVPENITIDTPKKDATIKIDHEKILIVFVNIILNAIQSIGDAKGKINISIDETETHVTIEFENSGPNIPSKDLKRVFDTLYTTKLEGTGLGLSSCKNIIEQHKGEITAHTNPVKFSIKLPK